MCVLLFPLMMYKEGLDMRFWFFGLVFNLGILALTSIHFAGGPQGCELGIFTPQRKQEESA